MELRFGKDMQSYTVGIGDEIRWILPIKVEDDVLYKVDYSYHDASDPCDMSATYRVKFIEKVPDDIVAALKARHELDKKIDKYLRS